MSAAPGRPKQARTEGEAKGTPVSAAATILRTEELGKSFGGFVAVDRVSLHVRRGSIHALIGPNGAGKSTFFNMLTRFQKPTVGHIFFEDQNVTHEAPAVTARRGMVRSFQMSAVFSSMTAADNIRVALQSRHRQVFQFWRRHASLDVLRERTQLLLAEVGLQSHANQTAGTLPYGQRRALELATTLAMEPSLLLLDEPTQGMGSEDVQRIAALIQRVAKTRTVLMVEHNMGVVASIADRITVLQRGAVIADGSYAEVASQPAVVQAYLGAAKGHA